MVTASVRCSLSLLDLRGLGLFLSENGRILTRGDSVVTGAALVLALVLALVEALVVEALVVEALVEAAW